MRGSSDDRLAHELMAGLRKRPPDLAGEDSWILSRNTDRYPLAAAEQPLTDTQRHAPPTRVPPPYFQASPDLSSVWAVTRPDSVGGLTLHADSDDESARFLGTILAPPEPGLT